MSSNLICYVCALCHEDKRFVSQLPDSGSHSSTIAQYRKVSDVDIAAWHYKKLPSEEFRLLILRALNKVVDIVTNNQIGDKPLEGDRVNFRSPGTHIQIIKENPREAKLTLGKVAVALRGIGEVMGIWGPTEAEILMVVDGERIARIYIEETRRP